MTYGHSVFYQLFAEFLTGSWVEADVSSLSMLKLPRFRVFRIVNIWSDVDLPGLRPHVMKQLLMARVVQSFCFDQLQPSS